MSKVRCRVCEREMQGYCPVKKTQVRLNKARTCKTFTHDITKVKIKQKLPAEMRPDWFHDRKGAMNKAKKEMKARETARKKELFNTESYMSSITSGQGTSEHPLTGDLSRFTTTANKKEEN